MQKHTRKIKKEPKVFIDASIIEYRYFKRLKTTLPRKYRKIITSKKEIKKLHQLLKTVNATEISIINNIKWLLEQFANNTKYKITEKNKKVKYCINNKLDVITMNTKFSIKMKLKGGNVELLSNKMKRVIRNSAVIDTCAFGVKDIEKILKEYKAIYIPSIVIKERGSIKNKKWPKLNLIPVWAKENPLLNPDDNILIFCSENNLELITSDKEMAAKAFAHGIKCRLLSQNGFESNNQNQIGVLPKLMPIASRASVTKLEVWDNMGQKHLINVTREKIKNISGKSLFICYSSLSELVYIIKKNGEIFTKTTEEIAIEEGDIVKHFIQAEEVNRLYCKIGLLQSNSLCPRKPMVYEGSLEYIEQCSELSELEKEILKEKYFNQSEKADR